MSICVIISYHFIVVLVRNKILETLNISGCELGSEAGIALAGVLSSGYVQLETLSLDVSNNDFGLTGIERKIDSYIESIYYIEFFSLRIFFP